MLDAVDESDWEALGPGSAVPENREGRYAAAISRNEGNECVRPFEPPIRLCTAAAPARLCDADAAGATGVSDDPRVVEPPKERTAPVVEGP